MSTIDPNTLVRRFWTELRDIKTGMLGLAGTRESHSQPMTAHFEGNEGPLYFYTRRDSEIAAATQESERGVFHYVGEGHDLYACIHGSVAVTRDQEMVDRFWSEEVARWFPDGPQGGTVALLRFDPDEAQIWVSSSSDEQTKIRLSAGQDSAVDQRAKAMLG